MEYSFPHYLLSKQSVDDRALNRVVLYDLKASLSETSIKVVEVGAGIGSMLKRLLRWGILPALVDYTLVDLMPENIRFARTWLSEWARQSHYRVQNLPGGDIHLSDSSSVIQIHPIPADVFDFIQSQPGGADLLIAHALLDLLPLPESLPKLFSLIKPGGLAWLTANFDGLTAFEPVMDPTLDAHIETLFHRTMDERVSGGVRSGGSRTGRHLFAYLQQAGAEIISSGASDWVVYPSQGQYPADEAYFLQFILYFFETSLTGRPDLDQAQFVRWLAARRAQLEHCELIYIAHQLDFLVRV